ncbi:MAG: hypothetical protein ACRC42_05165 [Mycoplasma sp.]
MKLERRLYSMPIDTDVETCKIPFQFTKGGIDRTIIFSLSQSGERVFFSDVNDAVPLSEDAIPLITYHATLKIIYEDKTASFESPVDIDFEKNVLLYNITDNDFVKTQGTHTMIIKLVKTITDFYGDKDEIILYNRGVQFEVLENKYMLSPRVNTVEKNNCVQIPVTKMDEVVSMPIKGMFRFNDTNGHFECYDGIEWKQLAYASE